LTYGTITAALARSKARLAPTACTGEARCYVRSGTNAPTIMITEKAAN
jgi:hypothetical protein